MSALSFGFRAVSSRHAWFWIVKWNRAVSGEAKGPGSGEFEHSFLHALIGFVPNSAGAGVEPL